MVIKTFLGVILTFSVVGLAAQSPVKWIFTSKKLDDKTYEVHLKAEVDAPWHIYSLNTPDGGPLPTSISFSKNPILTLHGKTKEEGDIIKKYEEVFGIDVLYFEGPADFVQVVKLKTKAKTTLAGKLEYMACNDEQCLPPTTIDFSVPLK